MSRLFYLDVSKKLNLCVYQSASPVTEQYVDFLEIQNRRYFSLAEMRVHHRLSLTVFACPVVRRSRFRFAHCHRGFYAAVERAGRRAYFTDRAGYFPLLGRRLNQVILLDVARRAHHHNRFTNRILFYFRCHKFIFPRLSAASRSKRAKTLLRRRGFAYRCFTYVKRPSEIRKQYAFNSLARQLFDRSHRMFFSGREKCDRAAFVSCAACAADTVNVILRCLRYVIVYHM